MAKRNSPANSTNETDDSSSSTPVRTSSLSPGKKWGFRIVTVLVASGLTALVFQLFLWDYVVAIKTRLFAEPIYIQEPGHERTGHRYLYDKQLGWRNIPRWSATTKGKKLTINEKGLRDRDYPYEKPPGTKRILVLGDSFVWGYGVADDEIFTERLEQMLEESPINAGEKIEVINTGVSGWGTDQEYLFLQQEGFKYSPDIVILAFYIGNDISNNMASRQYAMEKPVFLDRKLQVKNVPVPEPPNKPKPLLSIDPLSVTLALIERIRDECETHGAQLLVMKFGEYSETVDMDHRIKTADRILEGDLLLKYKIPYFDIDELFIANGVSLDTLLRGNDDGHWNAEGHRIVAGYLYDYLNAPEWLSPNK